MFEGFSSEDFSVFDVPGLENRMNALITNIRPKLNVLGQQFAPHLSALCGEEMFAHVAKHARRTVHPPKDTWVAWAANKRGYKALPHFQIGLWGTHVFIQFTIIYECTNKVLFANQLAEQAKPLPQWLPNHFYWSLDHTKPEVQSLATLDETTSEMILSKLRNNKNAEFLCGLKIDKDDPVLRDGHAFLQLTETTFAQLLPLYKLAFS
jgi:uncharacterized protein YktB (UPF0637 family)